MGFIRALTEFAAAAANLHPDHRSRFDELAGCDHPRADAESPAPGQSSSEPPRSSTSVETMFSAESSVTSTTPPASSRMSIS